MELKDFCLIFPSLFMIHEMEEIILMPKFISTNPFSTVTKKWLACYTPVNFNLIVFEQLLLLLIILTISYQQNDFTFYLTIVIAYSYHIIGHLLQSLFLRRYVPGLVSGIITSLFCSIFIQHFIKNNIQLYYYSILTLLVIFMNIVLAFVFLNKISNK